MCTVLLPPGNNPIAVNKYIMYQFSSPGETTDDNMTHARGMMDNKGNKHTLGIFNTEAFHGNNVRYTYTAYLVHFGMAFRGCGPQQDSFTVEYAGSFTEGHVKLKLSSI
jgi:hypothetical protein